MQTATCSLSWFGWDQGCDGVRFEAKLRTEQGWTFREEMWCYFPDHWKLKGLSWNFMNISQRYVHSIMTLTKLQTCSHGFSHSIWLSCQSINLASKSNKCPYPPLDSTRIRGLLLLCPSDPASGFSSATSSASAATSSASAASSISSSSKSSSSSTSSSCQTHRRRSKCNIAPNMYSTSWYTWTASCLNYLNF